MGCVSRITTEERLACYGGAVDLAKTALSEERNFVHPESKIGSLSAWEWDKLASAMVSGWIIERSRQLVEERFEEEARFLATGEIPEPQELGVCAAVLPALGTLVEKLGLSDKPIGAWSKRDICLFVWTCFDLVTEARTKRDERPGPADIADLEVMTAG